jgi:hydroxymethyl cephem carbamoyltransferase
MGVEHQAFKDLVGKFSDELFARFYRFASSRLRNGYPLLIGGGCALNCEWNTRWRECGLFPDVFVPPCPNDAGSALGTALDAQLYFTGRAKVAWSVDSGDSFVLDVRPGDEFQEHDLDLSRLAGFLQRGHVIGWVQGRCEMGPRALGNRSILAAPFSPEMRQRLNRIKQREAYRPIAPVCLEEEVDRSFDWQGESPYMLYFQRVKAAALQAVAHVDGTARVQTVSAARNPVLHSLLRAFKDLTGHGVLCNTSLNFKGWGFINRMSDLLEFCKARGLDGFVVQDRFFSVRVAKHESVSPVPGSSDGNPG